MHRGGSISRKWFDTFSNDDGKVDQLKYKDGESLVGMILSFSIIRHHRL